MTTTKTAATTTSSQDIEVPKAESCLHRRPPDDAAKSQQRRPTRRRPDRQEPRRARRTKPARVCGGFSDQEPEPARRMTPDEGTQPRGVDRSSPPCVAGAPPRETTRARKPQRRRSVAPGADGTQPPEATSVGSKRATRRSATVSEAHCDGAEANTSMMAPSTPARGEKPRSRGSAPSLPRPRASRAAAGGTALAGLVLVRMIVWRGRSPAALLLLPVLHAAATTALYVVGCFVSRARRLGRPGIANPPLPPCFLLTPP